MFPDCNDWDMDSDCDGTPDGCDAEFDEGMC